MKTKTGSYHAWKGSYHARKESYQGQPTKSPNQGPPPAQRPRTIPSHQVTKVTNHLHPLSFPIPNNFHFIPSTRTFLAPPSFIKAFEEGFGRLGPNLNKLNNRFASHLCIHNEVVPNEVFHFGVMPLFMVEHPIVPFNPNRLERNASKKLPSLDFLNKLLNKDSFPKESFPKGNMSHWKPLSFSHGKPNAGQHDCPLKDRRFLFQIEVIKTLTRFNQLPYNQSCVSLWQGYPTHSHRWVAWVWDNIQTADHFKRNLRNILQVNKRKVDMVPGGWSWKHLGCRPSLP